MLLRRGFTFLKKRGFHIYENNINFILLAVHTFEGFKIFGKGVHVYKNNIFFILLGVHFF